MAKTYPKVFMVEGIKLFELKIKQNLAISGRKQCPNILLITLRASKKCRNVPPFPHIRLTRIPPPPSAIHLRISFSRPIHLPMSPSAWIRPYYLPPSPTQDWHILSLYLFKGFMLFGGGEGKVVAGFKESRVDVGS